ncbi:MAG TPA: ribosome small subunit-dependent GTPase A [Sedimentibacter sp.]|jgi:ribosome biogenesis GTPase|nr:ribosome small subunit-dependent GTPase A [Sedimentibacter sp.]HPB78730.1 ribosome small subunit-dependent GTPase A [Sedimentibacter sp.]HPY55494.1 ribosome small subunit-dependent GTPase A [Sedimentibacter sp.]HQO71544.1 ribosome small subunit-dependent GTPase A [Sedimentibacter sp.]HQO94409.1 ribosome small subunit-dependent GTPase A [Sedimentibacter sp.]
MIEGIITKGVGGNYYVDIGSKIIECRARGLFRLKNIKPLVGDKVLIRITEEDEDMGYIEEIKERTSEIKRPPVANAQQLVIIFSVKNPEPSFILLDKLLIAAKSNNLNPVICINKSDLANEEEKENILNIFKNTGYKIIFTSKYDEDSLQNLKDILKDRLNVFSGPSGVGKSSLMNAIEPGFYLETGEISDKLKRGRHTTRHAEIFKLSFGGYAVDTPGFSSFELEGIDEYSLKSYYPEIVKYDDGCKFLDCLHYKEPGCVIKEAVNSDLISRVRYNNYIKLLEQIKESKPY